MQDRRGGKNKPINEESNMKNFIKNSVEFHTTEQKKGARMKWADGSEVTWTGT